MNISPKELDYFAYRGNEFLAIRPTSYMASIALDLGIFGILSVLCLLKPMLSLLKKGNGDAFPVVFYFIFLVFFSGAIGNPIPWVCIALVYRKYMNLSY
ncbi:hypothetical protein AGMMS49928_00670 [Spirochaetia bacterium]|nr:hypothetical protein AGMMS49928_00670 [Spirochaetia bacterium]